MRRTIFSMIAAMGIATATFGQTTSVDQQRVDHVQAVANDAIAHSQVQTSMMESKVRFFGFAQFRWLYD